jgi:hypothetical protein
MQPEVMLFMFGMILVTVKAAAMMIEYWRDKDKED